MITLQSDSYFAAILPEKGADCVSLRNVKYGAEILRERDQRAGCTHPYLYGMPILYPANRIAGGIFTFDGRIYRFPVNEPETGCHLHGTLHELSFEVAEQGVDHVKCVFQKEYMQFPHSFRMEICYRLSEEGLSQKVRIENLSGQHMPNFLGFHTTFCTPFLKDSGVEDIGILADVGDEIERDMSVYLPTGRILPEDEISKMIRTGNWNPAQSQISRLYKAADSGRIEIRDKRRRMTVVYETDQKFGWRLFYNKDARNYVCLEPMTCMANCQNAPFARSYAGFDSIPPYGVREYVSRIYLREEEKL